ncbi:MAG: efflux RND transporter periplasmic adaptor subunit [Desulfobacteraceae bacterium]|nr:efflux RND transporter periplasmic adaptor subunit [Desulfobacteraceae bacterium]
MPIQYSGTIKAVREVDMAFEVPGRIISFPITEGQRVTKGTLLAKLDPRDFQTILDSATADLNAARADYERSRQLYENNTISRRDLDVARRNFEVAKANTRSAKKAVDDTRLVAPFSGLIARKIADNFQNIQAKQPILVIHDDSSLEMLVDIPEQDYARIRKGTSLAQLNQTLNPQISVSSLPGQSFKAEFKETATTADPITRTFEITFGFVPPKENTILPGMTARLKLSGTMDQGAPMIPAKAVFADQAKNGMVWLIDPDTKKVKQHPVKVGAMSGTNVFVIKGLKTGDIIAISGVHQLRDGMTIRKYK